MKKTLLQGALLAGLLLGGWIILQQIPWTGILQINRNKALLEKILGDMYWDSVYRSEEGMEDPFVYQTVDSLLTTICLSNVIEREAIKLHIVNNSAVNAFALPDKHMVIHSALIQSANNETELSGVIAHELAHIEMDHVMQKLIKEIGYLILLPGSISGEMISESVRTFSSTAYSRKIEREADLRAVDYLANAEIPSDGLADFLENKNTSMKAGPHFTWWSTHPPTEARIEYIREYSSNNIENEYNPILHEETWKKLQQRINFEKIY